MIDSRKGNGQMIDQISQVDFANPKQAIHLLQTLPGQGITDDEIDALLPNLIESLKTSPDPDRALNNFVRWVESVQNRYSHVQMLLRHPAALEIFFNVCGVSQLFSDMIIQNPEYLEILTNPLIRGTAKTGAKFGSETSSLVDSIHNPTLKLEAMRRYKQREFLRIGVRDILELAGLPATAREFSDLADACVQKCLEIARLQVAEKTGNAVLVPFVVIGMGKHGGRELNYASDIDLMFVCGEPVGDHPNLMEICHFIAEQLVRNLTEITQNGHLFRVDMRLRPEGRFGALVRTLDSYAAYYESWAEPWERQALLKARAITGDIHLAEAWHRMAAAFTYRRSVSQEFLGEIRENKERIEQKTQLEGSSRTNVKLGRGGIRDVEFIVQLKQLELAGRFSGLRTPNTLDGLAGLRHLGFISPQAADELTEDYCFLRKVEHRLQILYELQTQSLPTEPSQRRLLARRLGFADMAEFDEEYDRVTNRVRGHFERCFLRKPQVTDASNPWIEWLDNLSNPSVHEAMIQTLEAEGFEQPVVAAQEIMRSVMGGVYGAEMPATRSEFGSLVQSLVGACSRTGDPDSALAGVLNIASDSPNPAAAYRSLNEGPELLDRLCTLSAGSPPLIQSLARRPEWLDMLVSEEVLEPEAKLKAKHLVDWGGRLSPSQTDDVWWTALANYLQRERLRIGARDLWGEINTQIVGMELTHLAEAAMQIILDRSTGNAKPNNLAVIGLGKFGGGELGYGSDFDVMFVYSNDRKSECESATLEQIAEQVLACGQELRPRGLHIEVDARLRPQGKKGPLAGSIDYHRNYYVNLADTWELQMLTKARPIAGCQETGRQFMELVHKTIYKNPMNEERLDEIRAMKRRMETERLIPGHANSDLKMGRGGLADIEFLVQILQLKHGANMPELCVPDTVGALYALGAHGILSVPDASRLTEAYRQLNRIRNRIVLLGCSDNNMIPTDSRRLRSIAVGLGFSDKPNCRAEAVLAARLGEEMRETRLTFEKEF